MNRKRRIIKKIVISISVVAAVLLIALTCIGFFWGGPGVGEQLWPYFPRMYNTIYMVNGRLYVEIVVNKETGHIGDVPYFYGEVLSSVKNIDFTEVEGRDDTAAGRIEADFFDSTSDSDTEVYRIKIREGVREYDDVLVTASGKYMAELGRLYSDNMKNDWEAYADELDIIWSVMDRKPGEFGSPYKPNLQIDHSPYFNTNPSQWHLFKKRLAIFFRDVKLLFV